jgi:signal transduction histidine kinase
VLHEFISANREEIIRRCRVKVAARSSLTPTAAEIDFGVPLFLEQLGDALRLGQSGGAEMSRSAFLHGHELLKQGFTLSQVVHDYGDVCQSVTELAIENDAPISPDDFRVLNGCLDNAIAGAVTQYGRDRDQSSLDADTERENVRLGFFSHELRNLLNTALIALEVIKTGNVGIAGSTGAVLKRNLIGARDLVVRSLDEIRLKQRVPNRERFLVAALIEEVAAATSLDANVRGVGLRVLPVEEGVLVEADRSVLSAVVTNILQNALKFTKPSTTVILRVHADHARVLIEVEDECGGLPPGNLDELFRPFVQRSPDRTGVGLGLAFSRWGAEASGGRVYARDLAGIGCVFTVDLPRAAVPAAAMALSRTTTGHPADLDIQ